MKPPYLLFASFALLSAPTFAQNRTAPAGPRQDAVAISRYAFVAGQVADIATSLGHWELNPLLRSPDGKFGIRGVAYKSAFTVGLLATQRAPYFRRRPRLVIAMNLAGFGVSALTAARNYRMR